jgi:hypothetical protein
MSSIMRRRRGLKSAISILLSEGVGSNMHILSARRRFTPPCPLRRGSGFVQSLSASQVSGKFDYLNPPFPDSKSMTWEFLTDDTKSGDFSIAELTPTSTCCGIE